jgi:hypothetical protein
MTDGNLDALTVAQHNITVNFDTGYNISSALLPWGDENAISKMIVSSRVDANMDGRTGQSGYNLIIGSDLLYHPPSYHQNYRDWLKFHALLVNYWQIVTIR